MSSGSLKKAAMKKKHDAYKRNQAKLAKVKRMEERLNSCGRKVRYSKIGFAVRAAENLQPSLGREIKVYCCRFCAGFHLAKTYDSSSPQPSSEENHHV